MRGERVGHTLQTTALINELYLRFSAFKEVDWQNRAHFFALCRTADAADSRRPCACHVSHTNEERARMWFRWMTLQKLRASRMRM